MFFCSKHSFERNAFTPRTSPRRFQRNRSRKMLSVITLFAFPAHGTLFSCFLELFKGIIRPFSDCLQDRPDRPLISLRLAIGAICSNARYVNVSTSMKENLGGKIAATNGLEKG
jgi:hypothetical protein